MYDNKVRLSKDILDKAEQIAVEWGLKNSRAAIEAVFRKYADDYLYGRIQRNDAPIQRNDAPIPIPSQIPVLDRDSQSVPCEALDELDSLLGM